MAETVDRRAADPWRRKIEGEIEQLRVEMGANTRMTVTVKEDVQQVHEILVAAKGAFKVLGWLGVAAKWIGIVTATCSAVFVLWYQLTHGGELPKK